MYEESSDSENCDMISNDENIQIQFDKVPFNTSRKLGDSCSTISHRRNTSMNFKEQGSEQ